MNHSWIHSSINSITVLIHLINLVRWWRPRKKCQHNQASQDTDEKPLKCFEACGFAAGLPAPNSWQMVSTAFAAKVLVSTSLLWIPGADVLYSVPRHLPTLHRFLEAKNRQTKLPVIASCYFHTRQKTKNIAQPSRIIDETYETYE